MKEHRCENCNKLLFKGTYEGTIEILCTRCKKLNIIKSANNKEHQPK